jgi:hypothetical protein
MRNSFVEDLQETRELEISDAHRVVSMSEMDAALIEVYNNAINWAGCLILVGLIVLAIYIMCKYDKWIW